MGFFVEVRGHDLGNQGLQHIGKEEEQEAAQQSCKGAKHVLHMRVLVVFGVEAADEKGNEESHTQEAPQGLLQHSIQNLAWFEISSTQELAWYEISSTQKLACFETSSTQKMAWFESSSTTA